MQDEIDGELLPALPEDVRPQRAPIVIRLPQARADDENVLEHEIRRPVRAAGLESDVAVPAAQAGITALAAAICAGVLAWALGWHARAVLVVFGVTLAGAWLWRMRVADSLLWTVERFTGHDMNHDGQIGQPATRPVLVNSWQARQEVAQLRVDEEAQHGRQELVAFLHTCFVKGTSEKAHGIARGSGAARENYTRQRDMLLELGIARWRNPERPSAGWKIAVSHERAVQLLAKHTL